MRASMHQSRAETAMNQAESIYNSERIPAILVALRSGEKLSPEQEIRFAGYLRAFNRNHDNLLAQYSEGLLNESLLRSIEGAVLVEVARLEYTRNIWESSKLTYSDDYIALVDRLISEFCGENKCSTTEISMVLGVKGT